MKFACFVAIVLAPVSVVQAQTSAAPSVSPQYSLPIPGDWQYAAIKGGSEASFRNAAGPAQFTLRCTRATRRVTLSKPAAAAAPFLVVWTSSLSRSIAVSFQPSIGQLVADVTAYDGLLDAMAFSRGRIGFSVSGQPTLVLPAYEEIARVVEDCRT